MQVYTTAVNSLNMRSDCWVAYVSAVWVIDPNRTNTRLVDECFNDASSLGIVFW